jgi:4-hydroxy-3-methylbut-2-enyl diphosphate reductase
VLNVWKRVESYARDGYTSIIHGKYYHEETRATASQVTKYPEGKYLVLFDMVEARLVCDFIERNGDPAALAVRFEHAMSPGFDFARDLIRVGLANQTTMLSGESLAIASEVRESMIRRYGEAAIGDHFRTFDTICSATQERQDAVLRLLEDPPDLMIVVGGYNSSNTTHLATLSRDHAVRTYHIEDASAVDVDSGAMRHQPRIQAQEETVTGWLEGVRTIGITAGASTPNNKIGETILRVCAVAGVEVVLPDGA